MLVEPHRLRYRWWASLISAAGPATNLLAGVVLTLVSIEFATTGALGAALAFLGLLQFVAGILNLLPVPGFDGWGIIGPYLSPRLVQRIRPIQPWAPLLVFFVLVGIPGASNALFEPARAMVDALGGSAYLADLGSCAVPVLELLTSLLERPSARRSSRGSSGRIGHREDRSTRRRRRRREVPARGQGAPGLGAVRRPPRGLRRPGDGRGQHR